MHIAIDDTYGAVFDYDSKYVTSNRRTNVAVSIPDHEVGHVREQIRSVLALFKEEFGIEVDELHFVDIYNRKPPWDKFENGENLAVFRAFFEIYRKYNWDIFIQTLDDYSYEDHDLSKFNVKLNNLDLNKREHLSLFFLLIKIKRFYKTKAENLTVFMDEGLGKPGSSFCEDVFRDYSAEYVGTFESSASEPLLQLADFVAFTINRNTHLLTKTKRTVIDNWFLEQFSNARFNCSDLTVSAYDKELEQLTVQDIDASIDENRKSKGLTS
ncbi:DUF3800 domain-containing protein [Vibrio sp. St2]|uniref:DUF3800 domain-containing protein n=1 Tax=Vibrio sp. St2 TaxID=2853441 RepID=UPI00248D5EAB|nr:DUF3800 domain-containing protein [Vibrio sp. St2]